MDSYQIQIDNVNSKIEGIVKQINTLNSTADKFSYQQLTLPIDPQTNSILRNTVKDIRNYKRITTVTTSDASNNLTPNCETDDMFVVTALAHAATIVAPIGNGTEGQVLIMRIKDNGTARVLTWNAIYRDNGVTTKPTTTTANKTMYLAFLYNSIDTKWDLLSYLDQL